MSIGPVPPCQMKMKPNVHIEATCFASEVASLSACRDLITGLYMYLKNKFVNVWVWN